MRLLSRTPSGAWRARRSDRDSDAVAGARVADLAGPAP
jgi:hypothetical protein